jgi:DNA segregation ATPase FtsK/SpoIIIE-like protein
MKTPVEYIDGTEEGKRNAMATLATNGLLIACTAWVAPFIMGGAVRGIGSVARTGIEMASWPWVTLSTAASVGAYLLSVRKIPRKVEPPRIKPGSWLVPIGKTYRGKWVYWDVAKGCPHTKVAGATGSGKSEFLKMALYVLTQQQPPERLQIHIIDLKGGATFASFERLPHVQKVYQSTAEALLALSYCESIMWDRLELIRRARVNLQEPPRFPCLMVVIDEGGELAPADAVGDEKKMREECMKVLSTLVRVGREPNVRVVYGTQRPDRYTLPMTIRSQLENTMCFRVREDYDSKIVLGHEGAEKIKRNPGRMIFQTPDGEIPVQAAYVSPDVLEQWLSQYEDRPDISSPSLPEDMPDVSSGCASSESIVDLTPFLEASG